ncbi:MAG: DUF2207 domain-containing protein [Acidobacteriia bacterium]|nr:DUF2207 domain-containing protein [Terriglobia bacterium]
MEYLLSRPTIAPKMPYSRSLRAERGIPLLSSLQRVAVFLLLVFAFAASASARELRINKFSSEIFVQHDSSLDVTETIEADFIGAWHGLYRSIPIQYVTPQGFNYTLFVKLISAETAGQKLKVESSHQGRYLKWKIYVDNATDVARTITLHYRVTNGVRFLEEHDELYWNATGDEWDVPLGDVSAEVFLPTGTTGIHTTQYVGAAGSRSQDAEAITDGNHVEFTANRPLAFHEGMTVVVGWDKGFVTPPSTGDLIAQFLASNWPIFIPIPVFLIMFWLWSTSGRDPRTAPVAVQYEPPDGLTPGEAGTLVDDNVGMRDITATIVDLAVRGYLVIEEKDKSQMMGLVSSKDYVFHMKKNPAEWAGLKPHELMLLAGIFSNGMISDVDLSSMQNSFYTKIPGITNGIFDALMQRGYFLHRPDYVRSGYIAGAVITAALMFVLGGSVAQRTGIAVPPFFVAAILSGLIIAGFGWYMPARTAAGAKALAGVLGFEDFLSHVESDRITRLEKTPATFEKFLPFAMALGVEKKWVGAFQHIYSEPPSWYQGGFQGGVFYPMMFVNSLDNMTARAGSVMSSAPRSSGSSGFGGGGSSGGGFGGGGGGGF